MSNATLFPNKSFIFFELFFDGIKPLFFFFCYISGKKSSKRHGEFFVTRFLFLHIVSRAVQCRHMTGMVVIRDTDWRQYVVLTKNVTYCNQQYSVTMLTQYYSGEVIRI